MDERAFVFKPEMGWTIASAKEVEATAGGLCLAGLPTAAAPLVDARGMFGGLDLPTGVAVDAVGRIYVADADGHVIKRFDPACPPDARVEVLPCLGGDGTEVRNLREPRGLAIRGDDLFVVDPGNARVLVLSLTHLALRAVIGPIDDAGRPVKIGDPGAWKPWDVVVDGQGRLYVSDRRGQLFRFSGRGRLLSPVPPPGAGEGPIHLAIACPPDLVTTAKPLFGEVELREAPRAGSSEARLEQDTWRFVRTGDAVEFRTAAGSAERRVVVVRDLLVREGDREIPWAHITWVEPLVNDYSGPGSFVRLVTAARAGDLAPSVKVESSTGWSPGDWLRIDGPSPEVAPVTDVRSETLVLQRSVPAPALPAGVRLSRITPLLAVADARPGEGVLRIVDADGAVLKASADRSDLVVFARYGGLAFGADILDGPAPAHPNECGCRTTRCCSPVSIDLESALRETLHQKITRIPDPRYATAGRVVIGPLDSRIYRCQWHRILADVDVPPATRLTLETLSSEAHLDFEEAEVRASEWRPARLDGEFANAQRARDRYLWDAAERDALVQSGPGRYLFLRITMSGDGSGTPTVRALHVTFPRRSYLEYLPAVYQEDVESRNFLDRFLSIFQATFDGFNQELDAYARFLDPTGTPEDFIPWLASWIALSLDWPWSPEEREARQRSLLKRAPELYRKRGTPAGLRAAIAAYTGLREEVVLIVEAFCARNWLQLRPEGARGSVLAGTCLYGRTQLNGGVALGEAPLDVSGDPALDPFAAYAHRFTVVVPASVGATPPLDAALRQLVDRERPAHTEATIYPVEPRLRVGIQSVIGVDTVIGTYPLTEVGKGYLGLDTVLTCPEPTGTEIGRTSRIGESLVVG